MDFRLSRDLLACGVSGPLMFHPRIRECFAAGRFRHRWQGRQIDSRSVSMTNKAQIDSWVKDYGEDSDFIRVRGVFPRAGSLLFIDGERLSAAVARPLVAAPAAPLIMGVDIARQGEDQTVIRLRRGLDARSIPAVKFRGAAAMGGCLMSA